MKHSDDLCNGVFDLAIYSAKFISREVLELVDDVYCLVLQGESPIATSSDDVGVIGRPAAIPGEELPSTSC